MDPLRVSATNYGPYPTVEWEIPDGLTAILGQNEVGDGANSNGSGKTKLLELVPICLFGPAMPWGEYLTVGSTGECRVELEFEHGAHTYRIRRIFDPRGRGKTTLDFERLFHGDEGTSGWEPLTRESQTATQAAINQIIGLSEATFAHSVFAAQGARHFADPSLPPRERKAILTEALGLEVWDRLLEMVRADIREHEAKLTAISATLGSIEDDLAKREEMEEEHERNVAMALGSATVLSEAEKTASVAREQYDEGQEQRKAFLDATERLKDARRAVVDLEARRDAGERAKAVAEALVAEIESLTANAVDVESLERELAGATFATQNRTSAISERDATLREIATHEAGVKQTNDEAETMRRRSAELAQTLLQVESGQTTICEHCKQPITTEEARTAAAEGVRKDIAALDARAAGLTEIAKTTGERIVELKNEVAAIDIPDAMGPEVVADLQARLGRARGTVTSIAVSREKLAAAQALAAVVEAPEFVIQIVGASEAQEKANTHLASFVQVTDDLISSRAVSLERANLEVQNARHFDADAKAAVAVSADRLRRLAELAERAQESLTARAGLLGRLDHLKALERAYGRDGVPALILESAAIPQVEAEAQRVLEQLGMPFRIELVTQRENKGGGLKDTLDVVVHEPNGARRYETYSGGERTRLELALRIALARLIVARRGAEVGMLALDEPSWLDSTGMVQLTEVLRGLTEFRSICLISHDERLVDAFDHQITVIRDETGSRLEDAA